MAARRTRQGGGGKETVSSRRHHRGGGGEEEVAVRRRRRGGGAKEASARRRLRGVVDEGSPNPNPSKEDDEANDGSDGAHALTGVTQQSTCGRTFYSPPLKQVSFLNVSNAPLSFAVVVISTAAAVKAKAWDRARLVRRSDRHRSLRSRRLGEEEASARTRPRRRGSLSEEEASARRRPW